MAAARSSDHLSADISHSHSHSESEPPPKRRRVALACDRCRERKIKCDGSKPVCGSCRQRGHTPGQCVYAVISSSARLKSERAYLDSLQSHGQSDASVIQTVDRDNRSIRKPLDQDSQDPLHSTKTHMEHGDDLSVQRRANAEKPSTSQHDQPHFGSRHADSLVDSPVSPRHVKRYQSTQPKSTTSMLHRDSAAAEAAERHLNDVEDLTRLTRQQSASTAVTSPVNAMGTSLSVMERSPTESEVFYGSSSVVSFLNQFQRIPDRSTKVPNTALTSQPNRSSRNVPHPAARTDNGHSSSVIVLHSQYSLPPRVVADMLLKAYFDNIHIFYPWIHTDSFCTSYEGLWTNHTHQTDDVSSLPDIGLGGRDCPTSTFYCALNAIFALGCQHATLSPSDKVAISAVVQERLDQLLPLEMLEGSELCHVQALMLAAQYFQCTSSPSRYWNIIGLAYRMAIGLGLHLQRDSDRGLRIELEMRRRVWHGCAQYDVMSCMTFGRSPTVREKFDVPLPAAIDDHYLSISQSDSSQPADCFSQNQFSHENIKLSVILDQILMKCYTSTPPKSQSSPKGSKFDALIELNAEMSEFEASLPNLLHWDKRKDNDERASSIFKRQSNVLHARFLHLKLLLHRPTFSDYCARATVSFSQSTQRGRGNDKSFILNDDGHLFDALQAQCALACVRAACELVTSVKNAIQQSATGAWWWSIFYVMTSATVLFVAEQQKVVLEMISSAQLEAAWSCCFAIAQQMSSEHADIQPYIRFLQRLRDRTGDSSNARSRQSSLNVTTDPLPVSVNQELTQNVSNHGESELISDKMHLADDGNFGQHQHTAHDFLENPGDHLLQNWQSSWQDIFYPASFMQEFDLNDLSQVFEPL